MKAKIIISLVFALLIAVFILFNRIPVNVMLFNFTVWKTDLSKIMLWSFFFGVLYAAILAFMGRIKLWKKINEQNAVIDELEDKNER